ncbi:MAG: FtsX-like permease family protein [Lentisphaerae bacterium]|nr:FtsX-like permease family protein [Lentisphaerota bacterium]
MPKADAINAVPVQAPVPWSVAFAVSWGSLRRRFLRSLITMVGVVLGIAFLAYMLVNDNIVNALVALRNDTLNVILQKNGVDIFSGKGTDTMMLMLIGLSLFTCLVGIINAMLMSVTERIKEIGTLKCLGAQDAFIVKTFFIEASLQGVMGTVLGVALGLLVGLLVNTFAYGRFVWSAFPAFLVVKSVVVSLVIGSLMSVLAAIAPAYWAARKQPVEAMRVEE